jgi:hypothetical protein
MRVPQGTLLSRNFRLLLACNVISVAGTAVALVAIPFAVLAIGGSAADVGYVAAAVMVPALIFPLGAVVADRLPRHQVMMAANALQAQHYHDGLEHTPEYECCQRCPLLPRGHHPFPSSCHTARPAPTSVLPSRYLNELFPR